MKPNRRAEARETTKTLKKQPPCCRPDKTQRVEKPPQEWTRTEALAIAKVLRKRATQSDSEVANRAIGSLLREAERKDCYTEVVEMLAEARTRLKRDIAGDRDRDADAEDADFDSILDPDGARIQFQTANFTIDYTVSEGASDQIQDPTSDTAVNVTLANGTLIGTTVAGNGVPDFIEMLGIWLEYYLQQYIAYGFNSPIQTDGMGNPIRLMVVVRAGGSATSPGGPIGIEDSLGSTAGLAGGYNGSNSGLGVTPGHELFHQVQYTYNSGGASFLRIYKEGTARWAEDSVNDAYNRYNMEVPDYLGDTTVSCFSVPNRYETVLYWKYLTEQLGTVAIQPQLGVDAIIALWQNLMGAVTDADGIAAINNTITALPGGVNILDTFANFAVANFAKDLGTPFGELVYEYLEDEEPRIPGGQVYTSVVPLDRQVLNGMSAAYSDTDTVAPWGLHYYVFDLDLSVEDITVNVVADPAFTEPFYRVLGIRASSMVVHKGSGAGYNVQIVNDMTDPGVTPIDQVVVIIGAYNVGGPCTMTVSVNEGVPSVMLVLDHSGSMVSQNKMQAAQDAATLFVDVAEANGVPGLGAVGFSTNASVLPNSALEVLDSAKVAEVKGDVNSLFPANTTSIGHGLQVGGNAFAADPVAATNEVIVLLSDGKENEPPMIADVQDALIAAEVKVYSVGLGTDWAIEPAKLEDISTATGGDYRMTDDPAVLQEFYLQILASTLGGDMDGSGDGSADSDADSDEDLLARVSAGGGADMLVASSKRRLIRVVSADSVLNVVLTCTRGDVKTLGLALVGPDGTAITADTAARSDDILYRVGRNYVLISAKLPLGGNHGGTWYAFPVVRRGSDVDFEIKAMLKSGLRLVANTNQDTLMTGDRVGLTASLRDNGVPVTGASIHVVSDQPLMGVGNYMSRSIDHPPKGAVGGERLSAKELKLQALLERAESDPFSRQTGEFTLNEDFSRGLGVYSNNLFPTMTQGSHTFQVVAKGQTPGGEPFARYLTFTKVARVRIDPEATVIKVSRVGTHPNQVLVTFSPADAYGNLVGPGFAPQIKVLTHSGEPAGDVVDHNDGSYSVRVVVADPIQPPRITLVVGSQAIPVPATGIEKVLEPRPPSVAVTTGPLNLIGWLAIVGLVVAVVALVLALVL